MINIQLSPLTPAPTPTMPKYYRATANQWACQENWGNEDNDSACILELRSRVEQLEAPDDKALRDSIMQLCETVKHIGHRIEALEAAANNQQQDEDAESAAAPTPTPTANTLLQEIARLIANNFRTAKPGHDTTLIARGVIMTMADWLRSEYPDSAYLVTPFARRLDEEAQR